MSNHVKFISYDGAYPCLCMGTLVLEVDEKQYTFGLYEKYCRFWYSGGCLTYDEDYHYEISTGPWEICINELPDELQQYSEEIEELFNENVPQGCCGGCI